MIVLEKGAFEQMGGNDDLLKYARGGEENVHPTICMRIYCGGCCYSCGSCSLGKMVLEESKKGLKKSSSDKPKKHKRKKTKKMKLRDWLSIGLGACAMMITICYAWAFTGLMIEEIIFLSLIVDCIVCCLSYMVTEPCEKSEAKELKQKQKVKLNPADVPIINLNREDYER